MVKDVLKLRGLEHAGSVDPVQVKHYSDVEP